MNKKEQVKKQTWEFFWRQKLKEVGIFLGVIGLLKLLASILSKWDWLNNYLYDSTEIITFWTGVVSLIICLLMMLLCLLFLGLIYILIRTWIESNWKKAKKRAEKKYKEDKKKQ